ncbi:hypothetical protein RclHR1_12370005 [Rhizophagus clarus]|uniref:Uncharacterized protein n=1 Tax=Rhizophagus clarus TaxID=94130 RepID=A0A2Z6QJF7_9GLOM|nr:hypothetical protein RclHR1_12370005 [Rhizophagus clarus]
MQAESSKNNPTFPSLEYFLLDDEYDSDDFNFLEYDLVEKLDEINMEQNEEIINEKMRKDNNAMVNDNENDIIIEDEDDVIVEDDVMVEDVEDNVININLQKKKRKRKITPELVRCKCGKEIHLDQKFRDKNLTTHSELSNCKYSNKGQQSIKVFFKPKKIRVEEENIIIKKVACKGLYEDKYQEYVLNSPAEFGGSIRPDIAAKELFPEIVKANFRLKSLGKTRCVDLKNYLCAYAIWILDKTTLSVRSKIYENFTTRESGICDECNKLRKNSRLNQVTKKQRATGKNICFISKWYLEHPLNKLLLNTNLKSLWVSTDNSDNDAEIWFKLAQFGKDGLFKEEKTFQELVALMKVAVNMKSLGKLYENILKVAQLIRALNWNGPIVGMTDCTKIRPKLTYSDELGCIQKNAIATQVRVVVLKIPMEKIPPLVIAMLPTNGESNAMKIYNLLMNVLIMSRDTGINLVSLGSDGAPAEFNAQ